ncbi:MAG: phosphoribosylpyrophosphate synthetase [Chitinophagaceae bacterium]|nr:phosphoribosylpyrophosphate synthetase [Chitinophagaceae bacterium]
MYVYDTVTEALAGLRQRGFTLDFNLAENCLICQGNRFDIQDFEISEWYRFEGDTDPSDEAVVYAVESNTGVKGVLVTGYGISAEGMSAELAQKLRLDRNG